MRRWMWLHKWSSLVCTAFMLLLCVTGLPLIFHHEIEHWLHPELEPKTMPADTPHVSLDRVLDTARAKNPGRVVQYLAMERDDDRLVAITLGADAKAVDNQDTVMVDTRTAALLGQPKLDEGFMYVMFKLHVDLFAGLPGTLFLGAMGALLLLAIISGALLYAPFMQKLAFGTVRRARSRRVLWLDLHNLLGVVTLAWLTVVTLTGVINTLGQPAFKLWQMTEVAEMTAPYKNLPPPQSMGSLQSAVTSAKATEPLMKLFFIAFPGTEFSTEHHFTIFMVGNTALTGRLLKPVLVDAQTARVTDSRTMPWYMSALFISQPLHFGDYGGLPLKILWALLDLATIIVLLSGLYLWFARTPQVAETATTDESPMNPERAV
jgi:uncharacterized iron-regulated membrane protein